MPALSQLVTLQSAAAQTGPGIALDATGYAGPTMVEVAETAGGTATVVLEGSFDGTRFYAVGYQQVDAVATPARAVAAVSVTASMAHVYQVLDYYPFLRARISAVAACAVTVKAYAVA